MKGIGGWGQKEIERKGNEVNRKMGTKEKKRKKISKRIERWKQKRKEI